jgi:hypothetical protein
VLQNLHYVALLMTIAATAFIMAHGGGYDTVDGINRVDLYVVGKVITGDTTLAAALAIAEAALVIGLWFIMPKVWQKD